MKGDKTDTISAYDVALYFLFRARELGAGDTISNLKMQKLLYYAQGHFLATYQKPLFDDKIEAWEYGPVVKNVYDSFKCYGRLAIDFKELDNFKARFIQMSIWIPCLLCLTSIMFQQ